MSPNTLFDWEKTLRSRFVTVQLIGEIGLSEEETAEIGVLIRNLICSRGFQETTRKLESNYSCTLAAYLVFEGLYNYFSGDYWSSVCTTTELPPNSHPTEWGQIFESVLKEYGLPSQFSGHRYVSAILGHGGIPRSSLPRFFLKMLQPSVEEPWLAVLPAGMLIGRWLRDSQRYMNDKPILRFLEAGSSSAIEFIERCREMAQETLLASILPLAKTIGLPFVVVEEYRKWLDQREEEKQGQPKAKVYREHLRLRRPIVLFDPWGQGILLSLPPQTIPRVEGYEDIYWEITLNDNCLRLPVRKRIVAEKCQTDELFEPLREPARVCRVRLYADERCLREWMLEELIVRPQYPFLAFDIETGELISRRDALRAKPIWILLFPGVHLSDRHTIVETLPRLTYDWLHWQAFDLDLDREERLSLITAAGSLEFPILDVGEPQLVGNVLFLGEQAIPIYVGEPPRLRLSRHNTFLPSQWRVELFSELAASPDCYIEGTLEALSEYCVEEEDALILQFHDVILLGTNPFGQYRLRVYDPLKRATEFYFNVIPHLEIVGADTFYRSPTQGQSKPVSLLIETDPATQLGSEADAEHLCINRICVDEDAWTLYEVILPPGKTEAPLRLTQVSDKPIPVFVPLHITIRRLRWSLLINRSLSIWQESIISLSLEELSEMAEPYFVVDLPIVEKDKTRIQLKFVDEQGTHLLGVSSTGSLLKSGIVRFDLRNVRETLRQTPAPIFEAVLNVSGIGEEVIEQTVLRIRRGIVIERLHVNARFTDSRASLAIQWAPNPVVRSRCLRLWSQTRPWAASVTIHIPDQADGHTDEAVNGDVLSAGHYLAEFFVNDPWVPNSLPARPLSTDPQVRTVCIGSLVERIALLSIPNISSIAQFDAVLERTLLRQTVGDHHNIGTDLEWCCHNLHEAHPTRQRALLESFPNRAEIKLFKFKLIEPAILNPLIESFLNENLETTTRTWFVQELVKLIEQATPSERSRELLLSFPDDKIQIATTKRLIRLGRSEGVTAVVTLFIENRLSEAEALFLLESNPIFTIDRLSRLPENGHIDSLLRTLENRYAEEIRKVFLRVGDWLRTQAGWGIVRRIEFADVPYCKFLSYEGIDLGTARIHISLHGESAREKAIFDVASQQIEFVDAPEIYICSKCGKWASPYQELLYYEHNHAVHGGVNSEFNPTLIHRLLQSDELEFSYQKPNNIWE